MRAPLPLALLLAACATTPRSPDLVPMTPPPGGAAPAEFRAASTAVWTDLTGASATRRAAYDGWRVRGPGVDLARTAAGWGGSLGGREVALVAAPGRLAGAGVDLIFTLSEKGDVVASGTWRGSPVRLELGSRRVRASTPSGDVDLTEMGAGMFNSYQGLLQVTGPLDIPQVVVALLSVLAP